MFPEPIPPRDAKQEIGTHFTQVATHTSTTSLTHGKPQTDALPLCCHRVNVVQWNEDLYEEQLVERTKDACGGPVDIVIDFSATSRSIRRALKCLAPVSETETCYILHQLKGKAGGKGSRPGETEAWMGREAGEVSDPGSCHVNTVNLLLVPMYPWQLAF